MSITKYTPGPWRQVTVKNTAKNGRKIVERHIVSGKIFVAVVESESDYSRHGYDAPKESALGNAQLISAAPEMYVELNMALAAIINPQSFNLEQIQVRIKAAIAKAEGRE